MESLELLGSLLVFISVVGILLHERWGWVIGFLGSLLSAYFFYHLGLYGQVLLNSVYAGLQVWGWFTWGKEEQTVVRCLNKTQRLGLAVLLLALGLSAPLITSIFFSSSVSELDFAVTILSLMAQLLTVYHYLESWAVWIIADTLLVILCILTESYYYALLYASLVGLAFSGWYRWETEIE